MLNKFFVIAVCSFLFCCGDTKPIENNIDSVITINEELMFPLLYGKKWVSSKVTCKKLGEFNCLHGNIPYDEYTLDSVVFDFGIDYTEDKRFVISQDSIFVFSNLDSEKEKYRMRLLKCSHDSLIFVRESENSVDTMIYLNTYDIMVEKCKNHKD